LLHQSAYGFPTPMHGRFAWLQDTYARIATGLERLRPLVGGVPCVYAVEGREHEIVAHAVAQKLGLPVAPWPTIGVPAPGLIVVYSLDDLPRSTLAVLAQRRPDQILFAHASPWTHDFPIAPALVERHAQAMLARAKRQLQASGVDVGAIDDRRMIADFREGAEQEARGNILVQAIAAREGITAADADVQKRVAELATARNESPKKLRADLEREQAMPQLEAQIREQKTLDMLISQAKITDEDPATVDKLIVTPEEAAAEAKAETKAGAKATSKSKPKKKEPTP